MIINEIENVPEDYKDWNRILIELGYKSRSYSESNEITNHWYYVDSFGEKQWCVDFIEYTENHIPTWKPTVYEFQIKETSDSEYEITDTYEDSKTIHFMIPTDIKSFRDKLERQIKIFKEIKIKCDLKKMEKDFK